MEHGFFHVETGAAALAGTAAFLGVAAWLVPARADKKLRMRLKAVAHERARLSETRLDELAARGKARIRRDGGGFVARLMRRGTPAQASSDGGISARLRMAGYRRPEALAFFLFLRMALPAVFAFAAFAVVMVMGESDPATAAAFALAAAASGYALPRLALDRIVARRQQRVLRAFPDALDLLLICVQSGLSAEAALGRVTKEMPAQCIELAEELSLTMAELSYLPLRWRAYANLGERVGLPAIRLITAALVQAERHGASISQALASAAQACREARIAEAEYKAAALPAKLSAPLVIFFLPVLLTVILAPTVMEAGRALKAHSEQIIERNAEAVARHRPDAPASLLPPSPRADRVP